VSETNKKLVLLLTAVVLTLGAAEILLRVKGYGVITPEMNFGVNTKMALDRGSFLPDPDLFWKLPSHRQDALLRAVQPDVPIPAKRDRRRILVLGDSCSRISRKLPPYSSLLEDSLQSQNIEVWNASVPGYTVWQGRAWLRKQLLAMQPDVAVIYFGWNDHWRATGITDAQYASRLNSSKPRLMTLFQRTPQPPPLRIPVDEYRNILEEMVLELQEAGVRTVLVAGPENLTAEARQRLLQSHYLVAGDNAVILHQEYLSALRQVAATTGADLLDAEKLFKNENATGLLMRDGIHLTDSGHQMMAFLLADRLRPLLSSGADGTPEVD
jgi:lysophospholipase L1-like esterase